MLCFTCFTTLTEYHLNRNIYLSDHINTDVCKDNQMAVKVSLISVGFCGGFVLITSGHLVVFG